MSKEELHKKVSNWLNSQGYPLEMEFAKLFSENGFDIIQSYHFKDTENDSIRETDIIARYTDAIGLLQLHFVTECKKSKLPWVVFSSKSTSIDRLHSFSYMTENSWEAVTKEVLEMTKLPWFKKPERIGYSITDALKEGKDQSYSAMMSVTKGTMAYFKRETQYKKSMFYFVFPLIVFDGVLFESYLDDSSTHQLVEVEQSFVQFQVPIGQQFGKTVRIVTKKYVEKLIEEIKSMDAFLKTALEKHLKQADEKLFSAMQRTNNRKV